MTFRQTAPLCPECGALFEQEMLFDMRVERCGTCGGAWLDALDPPLDATLGAEGARGELRAGARPCPRCDGSLAHARLAAGDALACARCNGTFVPRSSFALVLGESQRRGTMPPPRENHVRVLALLRALARRPVPPRSQA